MIDDAEVGTALREALEEGAQACRDACEEYDKRARQEGYAANEELARERTEAADLAERTKRALEGEEQAPIGALIALAIEHGCEDPPIDDSGEVSDAVD